jgi:hypothetical protein
VLIISLPKYYSWNISILLNSLLEKQDYSMILDFTKVFFTKVFDNEKDIYIMQHLLDTSWIQNNDDIIVMIIYVRRKLLSIIIIVMLLFSYPQLSVLSWVRNYIGVRWNGTATFSRDNFAGSLPYRNQTCNCRGIFVAYDLTSVSLGFLVVVPVVVISIGCLAGLRFVSFVWKESHDRTYFLISDLTDGQ